MSKKKWLMKTEPNEYSIDNLKEDNVTHWEGIRNYQARNFMMKEMTIGDDVLIYHSNATPPGIVGQGTVASAPYPDHFAWNEKSKYFDSKSPESNPRWYMVDIKFKRKFDQIISLPQLKEDPKLIDMLVIKKGMRLSIQPVKEAEFNHILSEYIDK